MLYEVITVVVEHVNEERDRNCVIEAVEHEWRLVLLALAIVLFVLALLAWVLVAVMALMLVLLTSQSSRNSSSMYSHGMTYGYYYRNNFV